jgi:hypothetical protein
LSWLCKPLVWINAILMCLLCVCMWYSGFSIVLIHWWTNLMFNLGHTTRQCYNYRWMLRRFQRDRYTLLHNSLFRGRGWITQPVKLIINLYCLLCCCPWIEAGWTCEEWHFDVCPNRSKMRVVSRINVWAGGSVWINLSHRAWVNDRLEHVGPSSRLSSKLTWS